MPRAVGGALEKLRSLVAGFSIAQRTIALIGLAAVVLGGIALASWLTRPTMTPLFTSLSATDAGALVDQLQSDSVPYELTDGGSTVLVPQKDVYDQRLAAAAAGLPSSSPDGYTLLDEMGVTASEFQQSVTYKRAIEGELARTIDAVDGVEAASVHLAIPEESVFVSETVDPTASVFVQTKAGAPLNSRQVEAIVHLTSAAVSGLSPDNVAVVDQKGQTLSAAGDDTGGDLTQGEGDYERRVSSGIQRMLDTVVGAGNATVSVTAEFDRSTSSRHDETFTPAEDAPPSSEHTKTSTSNGGQSDTGVLGPDNIAVPSDGAGTTETTETTRNNVVNKSVEDVDTPAGSLKRQSVSVAVDSEAAGEISVQQLRDLVTSAAGIDTDRGDTVAVNVVAFNPIEAQDAQAALQQAKDEAAAERRAALLRSLIIAAAIAVPVLVALIVVLVRRRRRGEASTPDYVPLLQDAPRQLETGATPTAQLTPDELFNPPAAESLTAPEAAPAPAALEPPPDEPEGPEQLSLDFRRAELDAAAGRDPQHTAELLRELIADRADA